MNILKTFRRRGRRPTSWSCVQRHPLSTATTSSGTTTTIDENTYDYIVLGAGSAGCVVTNRLATSDKRPKVLCVEAGGKDTYPWIHVPLGYLYTMKHPKTSWGFNTTVQPGLNGRSLWYPRGKVLGGCSSINGMIYQRGQQRYSFFFSSSSILLFVSCHVLCVCMCGMDQHAHIFFIYFF